MRVDDPPRDLLDEHRRRVAPLLDLTEHGASPVEQLGIGLIPRGHRDVDPRAVLIERFVRLRFDAELANSDHNVGNLDAGVVDVVVHLDGMAGAPEHTRDRVSDARVAQVADMRRLVGVGGGVLDESLPGGGRPGVGQLEPAGRLEIGRHGEHRLRPGADVEVGVDVPRRGHGPCVHPGHGRRLEAGRKVGGDRGGRATEDARQAQWRRRRPVAELGARRALDHHLERSVHAEIVERTPHGLDEQHPGVRHIAQG